jgi:hypothetical protein
MAIARLNSKRIKLSFQLTQHPNVLDLYWQYKAKIVYIHYSDAPSLGKDYYNVLTSKTVQGAWFIRWAYYETPPPERTPATLGASSSFLISIVMLLRTKQSSTGTPRSTASSFSLRVWSQVIYHSQNAMV